MIVSLIVAAADSSVIGKDNRLLWHLPADLKYFKKVTMGHHLLMGRKTFETIGRPLPGRTNVVITRDPTFAVEGCVVVHSPEEALDTARRAGETEAFVIGGGEIYRQTIDRADRIYLTRVEASLEGDVHFPEIEPGIWREVSAESFPADKKNPYDCTFLVLERI